MTKFRLEAVSDAIFAIVMTLLVIEIKVPELHSAFTEDKLLEELQHLTPLFLSFFLSFAVLTTYWIFHGFLISLLAKNTDRNLAYLNLLFFSFISLIPFSSHLLGTYPASKISVAFYSINILIISILMFVMREYIKTSRTIENPELSSLNLTKKDNLYGNARLLISIFSSIFAVIFSLFNINIAYFFIIAPIVIGLIPNLLALIMRVTRLDKLAEEV